MEEGQKRMLGRIMNIAYLMGKFEVMNFYILKVYYWMHLIQINSYFLVKIWSQGIKVELSDINFIIGTLPM